jgi:hypothetical protein
MKIKNENLYFQIYKPEGLVVFAEKKYHNI